MSPPPAARLWRRIVETRWRTICRSGLRCMRRPTKRRAGSALLVLCLCACAFHAPAQTTTLPGITVTAPYTEHHGGYVISGDFKVDPRMPYVVFPALALVKDDILSVRPLRLNDDEYLVLQECAVADCSQAHLVRVWGYAGALTPVSNSDYRIWIRHENKYFIWLMRLPAISTGFAQFFGHQSAVHPGSGWQGRGFSSARIAERAKQPSDSGEVLQARRRNLRGDLREWQHRSHQAHARGALRRGARVRSEGGFD